MTQLITNIKELFGVREEPELLRGAQLSELPSIKNAWLRIDGNTIVGYGSMDALNNSHIENTIAANGQFVLPCWCDSHTHLVFAGSREHEFVDKIHGKSYEEIAQNGGGILHSAKGIAVATEEALFNIAMQRVANIKKLGTAAVEIKSGYGLSVEGELKMLRVIKRLKKESGLLIKATFLGAHAYPLVYKNDHQGYISLIIEQMLPVIQKENLADYIDVFCETGFFSPQETEQIIDAGKRIGLKAKLHANQLNRSGGVQVGVKHEAVSVDHLESIGDEEIAFLKNSNTIATLLPNAAFFLRMPYPPVRSMLENNIAVAIASDYNPGSAPSGNMPLLIALSCIQMKMTPAEAINAGTLNGSYAMEVDNETGSITIGKKANLIFTKPIPSIAYLPYSFGDQLIDKVMINGQFV